MGEEGDTVWLSSGLAGGTRKSCSLGPTELLDLRQGLLPQLGSGSRWLSAPSPLGRPLSKLHGQAVLRHPKPGQGGSWGQKGRGKMKSSSGLE